MQEFLLQSKGDYYTDSNGNTKLLLPILFLWLGDQEELNKLAAGVYALACRKCYWPNSLASRTKVKTIDAFQEMFEAAKPHCQLYTKNNRKFPTCTKENEFISLSATHGAARHT